jgi:hypothetical protein
VRCILATAAVEGYLRRDDEKFLKGTQEVPSFSATVKATLKNLTYVDGRNTFKDPISKYALCRLATLWFSVDYVYGARWCTIINFNTYNFFRELTFCSIDI